MAKKKIPSAKQRAARLATEQQNNRALIKAISSKPNSFFEAKLAPRKDTIIFRGMTAEIAEKFSCTWRHDLQFPLEDFYAEVPQAGRMLRIHWMPYDADVAKKAMRDYFVSKNIINLADNGNRSIHSFAPSDIVGTIYVGIGNIYSVGYVIRIGETSSVLQIVTESAASNNACDLFADVETITYTIQTFVALYMNGDPIPDLGITLETSANVNDSKKTTTTLPSPTAATNDGKTACIYYRVDSNQLEIGGGGKEYHLKWWIVCGHDRHLSNGNVVHIEPYIKGDKDDPEAIKALAAFVAAKKRIRCFKLVPKSKSR